MKQVLALESMIYRTCAYTEYVDCGTCAGSVLEYGSVRTGNNQVGSEGCMLLTMNGMLVVS